MKPPSIVTLSAERDKKLSELTKQLRSPHASESAFACDPLVHRYSTSGQVMLASYPQQEKIGKDNLYYVPSFMLTTAAQEGYCYVMRLMAAVTAKRSSKGAFIPNMENVVLIDLHASQSDARLLGPSIEDEAISTKRVTLIKDDTKDDGKVAMASIWAPSSGATLVVQVIKRKLTDSTALDEHDFSCEGVIFTAAFTHSRERAPKKPRKELTEEELKENKKKRKEKPTVEEKKMKENDNLVAVLEELIEESDNKKKKANTSPEPYPMRCNTPSCGKFAEPGHPRCEECAQHMKRWKREQRLV
jgi:hypothetical protein